MQAKANQAISGSFIVTDDGALTDADSTPTGQLKTNGVDDVATITITNSATGKYRWQMTVPSDLAEGDNIEIEISATVNTVNTAGKVYAATIVSYFPGDIYGAISTILNRLGSWTGTGVNTILGAFQALFRSDVSAPSNIGGTFDPATDSTQAIAAAAFDPLTDGVDVDFIEGTDATDYYSSLVSTITAAITALQTKILRWFRLAVRKDPEVKTDLATEIAEFNANTGTGVGSYDNVTDSLQALRDRGDLAWTGSGGGGGGSNTTFLVMPQANIGRATHLPEQPYVGAQANLSFGLAGDVSAATYELIIESQTNTADIAEIAADSAVYDNTANVTTVSFTVPANTHNAAVTWQYAVRQNPATTNRVVARGPYPVKYAPQGD